MAEFYGYFSLDIDGNNSLAILYRREDNSLAARKFILVPSYVSNIMQDSHLSTLPMVIVEDTIIDVLLEMIRFPVYVVLRSFFHSGEGNRIIFERGKQIFMESLELLYLNLGLGIFLVQNMHPYFGIQMKVSLVDGTWLESKLKKLLRIYSITSVQVGGFLKLMSSAPCLYFCGESFLIFS
jgi:hypothetical protein